ncbi:MAG: hypothetical protein ACKO7W_19060 [Elainella sp.]
MSSPQLRLNLSEGSVSFSFSPEAAQALKAELAVLMQRLKAVAQSGGKPGSQTPQQPIEYRYVGDVVLEVFCNPNIWPTPFAAKVLLTLRDPQIRLSVEAGLTQISEDLEQFIEQYC